MKLLKTKTARFSQVIENCGKPQVYTLWQKPSADRHLNAQITKKPCNDNPEERKRNRFWDRRS